MKSEDMRQATGLSERLIQEYCELSERYKESERLKELKINESTNGGDILFYRKKIFYVAV